MPCKSTFFVDQLRVTYLRCHLYSFREVAGFESVEVYTSGESGSIPYNRVLSSGHEIINQRINLLPATLKISMLTLPSSTRLKPIVVIGLNGLS